MYANSGYFEGSIITDAEITAATLKTATIIGTGNNPALTIKDAANGIHFYRTEKEKDGNGNETHQDFSVFELNNDNITANVSNIVFNDNFKIEKSGKLLVPYLFIDNSESSSGLALDKN